MEDMEDSTFMKIVSGDIPCHKIYENDTVLAFLDIEPRTDGHTLVIPKIRPTKFVWDLDNDIYDDMMRACKKIALHMCAVSGKKYVHQAINGLDVPYAHIHLIPYDTSSELHGRSASDDEILKQLAEKLYFDD